MSSKAIIRALLILFALFLSASAQPQTITGKVVGVSDGDDAQADGYRKARNCPR